MDQVDLPLLHADDTVELAIARMNEQGRRFAVVEFGSLEYRSFSNKEMLNAWARRIPLLREVGGGQPVSLVRTDRGVAEIMGLPWGDPRREAARAAMESAGCNFGIAGDPEILEHRILVLTLHEGVADDARSTTKDCVCRNDSSHNGQCPPKPNGTQCPTCGLNTWRCA